MNRNVLAGLVAAATLAAVLVLSACTPPTKEPLCTAPDTQDLVIVRDVTAHASVGVDPAVECIVTAALFAGIPVSVIAADGDPAVTLRGSTGAVRTENITVFHDDLPGALTNIAAAFVPADDDGLDLLAALSLAADLSEDSTVIVISSGLSDAEPLSYPTPGMLDADAQEVAAQVMESGALTDAGGIVHVEWFGAGYGAGEQGALHDDSRDTVRATWAAILGNLGVNVVFNNAPLAEKETFATPRTVVPTLETELTPIEPKIEKETASWALGQDGPVSFVKDSSDYLKPDLAHAAIAEAAAQILAHGGCSVIVSGTTAEVPGMSRTGAANLAERRAATVAQGLIDAGVPADCISTRGYAGADSPWYSDNNPGGVFDAALAVANRSVHIEATN